MAALDYSFIGQEETPDEPGGLDYSFIGQDESDIGPAFNPDSTQSQLVPPPENLSNLDRLSERLMNIQVPAWAGVGEMAARQDPTMEQANKDLKAAGTPLEKRGRMAEYISSLAVKGLVDIADMFTEGDVREEMIEVNNLISSEARATLGNPEMQYTGSGPEKFGMEVAEGATNMIPALVAGWGTKNPGVTLGVMGGQVAGNTYNRYMEETGGDHTKSMLAAKFHTAAEIIPETFPVMAIMRKAGAGQALTRMLEATIGEGAQEMLTSVLQQTYDNAELEKMSLGEAIKGIDWGDVAHDGAIGVFVGGTLATPGTIADIVQDKRGKPDQADNPPELFTPTHTAGGGQPVQVVTKKGQVVPDTYMTESGEVIRDSNAIQNNPGTDPTEFDIAAVIERTKTEIGFDAGIVGSQMEAAEMPTGDMPGSAAELPGAEVTEIPIEEIDVTAPAETGIINSQIEPAPAPTATETEITGTKPVEGSVLAQPIEPAAGGPAVAPADQVAHEEEHATEPVEATGWARATAIEYQTKRPEFGGLILSHRPGDKRGDHKATHYYGEIPKTVDADGMPKDVILNKDYNADADTPIFIASQLDYKTKEFRQNKILAGFENEAAARKGYTEQFGDSFGGIKEISQEEFQKWKQEDGKIPYAPAQKTKTEKTFGPKSKKPEAAPTQAERMLSTGEQLYSVSGRELSPAPRVDATSPGKTTNSVKRINQWLLEEAKKEVAGDGYRSTLLESINLKNLSQSDQDDLNLMVFGDPDGPTNAANRKPTPKKLEPKSKKAETKATVSPGPIGTPGKKVKVNVISTGETLDATMAVVDASELIASNDLSGNPNPAYPKEIQPRDRKKGSSQLQVQKMANDLKPELLEDNGQANGGAPIIGPDGVVESGNGRTLAIQMAYAQKKADAYRQHLIDNAASYGLTEADIKAMKSPVLVRTRQGDMSFNERAEFARQANQSGTAPMTPVENAQSDAERITDEEMQIYQPSDQGNILAASNQSFLEAFGKRLGDLAVGGLSTADGRWTKQMADRVQAAVFYKAYGDENLLALTAEEADPDIKNILSALNRAAPAFARARAVQSDLGALDIISDMVAAIDLIRKAKAEGTSIKQLSDQGGLFGGVDPVVGTIAEFLESSARSPKRIGIGFSEMAKFLESELKNLSEGSLFEMAPATKADIVTAANKRIKEEYGDEKGIQDLFSQSQNQPGDGIDIAEPGEVSRQPSEGVREEAAKPATAANIKAITDQGTSYVPQNTVKAYKLFTTKKGAPNILYPLFVDADIPVPIGEWVLAHQGETKDGKVKSKIGHLANRPGWHSGAEPIAPQIGKKDPGDKKPTWRAGRQIWAEVEIPADIDWQTEATSRAEETSAGKILPRTAHITDQIPAGGHYNYKTNPNQPGEWMISGAIKVNRILSDTEVSEINAQGETADLPRKVGPDGKIVFRKADLPMDKESRLARAREQGFDTSTIYYHGTQANFPAFEPNFKPGRDMVFVTESQAASEHASRFGEGVPANVIPLYIRVKNTFDFREMHNNDWLTENSDLTKKEVALFKKYQSRLHSSSNPLTEEESQARWDMQKRINETGRDYGEDLYDYLKARARNNILSKYGTVEKAIAANPEWNRRRAWTKNIGDPKLNDEELIDELAGIVATQTYNEVWNGNWRTIEGWNEQTDSLGDTVVKDWIRDHGYDSFSVKEIMPDGREVISIGVLDPSNVRSINAAFDPNETESSQLLARKEEAQDPYAEMMGRDISYPVKVESTGKVYTVTVDAGVAMQELDTRLKALRELRACI